MTGARPKCLACGKPCTDKRGGHATTTVGVNELHAHPQCMATLKAAIGEAVLGVLRRLESEWGRKGRR